MSLLLLGLSACRVGGVRSVEAENDRLRQELIARDQTRKDLEGQIAELKVKLAEANKAQKPLPEEVRDALPRITDISISSLSGFEPTDPGKPATGVTVWFETNDGRGRFVQAVGTAEISALLLPPNVGMDGNHEPSRIASATLNPAQLRDAYRSSFTGTHYSVEMKLETPVERGPGKTPSLVLRVEFTDALTGQVLKGERVISPTPPAPAGAVRPD